jgi:predicted regulator of Ras-like GTPase activity (Roadblock/LC7/MglB family)
MSEKVADGKVEIGDLEDRLAISQSLQLRCLKEKVGECSSTEFGWGARLWSERGFDCTNKMFVEGSSGFVCIGLMNKMRWL